MAHREYLIVSSEECVDSAIKGCVLLNNDICKIEIENKKCNLLVRIDELNHNVVSNKVKIISGGGAGHEPFPSEYIGKGMLCGSVCGNIFTSPPSSSIEVLVKAIQSTNKGILMLILNYTGDRLNFGLAQEKLLLNNYNIKLFACGDDSALDNPPNSVGRRGLAGIAFMIKIAGAMAEEEFALYEIMQNLDLMQQNIGTVGIAFNRSHVPGSTSYPSFPLDMVELGLGIHGEAGAKCIPYTNSQELLQIIYDKLTFHDSNTSLKLKKGMPIAVLLNNLGGLSKLEEEGFVYQTVLLLQNKGLNIVRLYSNCFLSSLQTAGVQLCILYIVQSEWVKYLDVSTTASIWKSHSFSPKLNLYLVPSKSEVNMELGVSISEKEAEIFSNCIKAVCQSIIGHKQELNDYDTGSGDGDCGTTMANGALAIIKLSLPCYNPHQTFLKLSNVCEESMGGTSGALYALLFMAAASIFKTMPFSLTSCKEVLSLSIEKISQYSKAFPGDRTMLDSLHAINEKLLTTISPITIDSLQDILKVVMDAAYATQYMKCHAGRAMYVPSELLINPDPGAVAVALCIKAIISVLLSSSLFF